jgi:hypothetical protein
MTSSTVTQKSDIAIERPDLKKEPTVFLTVKAVGWGALFGSGFSLIESAAKKIRHEPITGEDAIAGMLLTSTIWAVMVGAVRSVSTMARNKQKELAKPYVEKLEAELAAKTVASGDSPKR